MLIRWATKDDLPAWYALATELSTVFRHPGDMGADPDFRAYAQNKTGKLEALTAVDYRTNARMGFIGFSRFNNRISWFGVYARYRRMGVGGRLLKTALRQMDGGRPITVDTFPEGYAPGVPARALYQKYGFIETETGLTGLHGEATCRMTADLSGEARGGSFHYQYPNFLQAAEKEHCPVCQGCPSPESHCEIAVLDDVWVCGEYPGQGRLFGKLYIMPREHYAHFEDMPEDAAVRLTRVARRVGGALRSVTGADKINYEMHANSGAHLHMHLFPRYLDDDFPSAPIDYRVTEPPPYQDKDEFDWFIARMREALS